MNSLFVAYAFVVFASLIPVLVLFAPVYFYLTNGWRARNQEILSSFPESVLKSYFSTFYPLLAQGNNLVEAFRKQYFDFYGRGRYLWPGLLLGILCFLMSVTVMGRVATYFSFTVSWGEHIPPVALFAMAGGYMWVVWDLLVHVSRRDLSPSDLLWGSFRFMICIPLGYAFAQIFKAPAENAVAFMIGAFPTNKLMGLLRSLTVARFQLTDPNKESTGELSVLLGVGRAEEDRYAEQGVSTVLQLAYADPVEMTIRTGYSFNYVVDCCSQAVAWLSFGQDMKTLRRCGLPGAQEIRRLVLELDRETNEESETLDQNERLAKKTLEILGTDLNMDVQVLERKFRDIAWNPNTVLLDEIWQPDWN